MAISRRSFLKTSAAVGTLAAFEANLGANLTFSKSNSKFVPSVCEMCSTRCPIEAEVVNDKCRFIQGNPKFGANKTSVCARGGAGVNQLYDPKRIVKPLIRVGKRGENRWREASWDEALNLCAKKLGEIKDKYGPQSVVFTSKSGESHTQMMN
ncbi:MAG: molybdopterin-dependent oxidoreductase, partial [Campylobacter hyointestinalis]